MRTTAPALKGIDLSIARQQPQPDGSVWPEWMTIDTLAKYMDWPCDCATKKGRAAAFMRAKRLRAMGYHGARQVGESELRYSRVQLDEFLTRPSKHIRVA